MICQTDSVNSAWCGQIMWSYSSGIKLVKEMCWNLFGFLTIYEGCSLAVKEENVCFSYPDRANKWPNKMSAVILDPGLRDSFCLNQNMVSYPSSHFVFSPFFVLTTRRNHNLIFQGHWKHLKSNCISICTCVFTPPNAGNQPGHFLLSARCMLG